MDTSEFRSLKNYIFGSTAAIVTNISLIVGLGSADSGLGPILGALLTIAIADNISDSLGMHLYKEAEGLGTKLSFIATALSFTCRLLVSFSFIAIVLAFPMDTAIPVAIAWGLFLLVIVSYLVTRSKGQGSALEIVKHLSVAIVVIVLSHFTGRLIAGLIS